MSGYSLDTNTQNSKVVHISSVDATTILQTDSTSYFSFVLGENFVCPSNQSMLISLHSASIPYSFYNIRDEINNKIPYTCNGIDGVITIPAGNYNSSTLAKKLASLLSAVQSMNGTLEVEYDRSLMKYKYTLSNGASDPQPDALTLRFTANLNTAYIELGFILGQDVVITGSGVYSSNVADVNGNIHGLYIRTNLSLDGSYDSVTKGISTILGRIPITKNYGGVLFWDPSNGSQHKIQIQTNYIHTITIRMTDSRNRLIDLNGLNFEVAIQFDFVYNKVHTPVPIPLRYQNKSKKITPKKVEDNNVLR